MDAIEFGSLVRSETTCKQLLEGAPGGFFDPADLRAFANAPRVHYMELPEENHYTLPMRIDLLGEPLASWTAQATQSPALPFPQEHLPKP